MYLIRIEQSNNDWLESILNPHPSPDATTTARTSLFPYRVDLLWDVERDPGRLKAFALHLRRRRMVKQVLSWIIEVRQRSLPNNATDMSSNPNRYSGIFQLSRRLRQK